MVPPDNLSFRRQGLELGFGGVGNWSFQTLRFDTSGVLSREGMMAVPLRLSIPREDSAVWFYGASTCSMSNLP
jgi:hypothetical protein